MPQTACESNIVCTAWGATHLSPLVGVVPAEGSSEVAQKHHDGFALLRNNVCQRHAITTGRGERQRANFGGVHVNTVDSCHTRRRLQQPLRRLNPAPHPSERALDNLPWTTTRRNGGGCTAVFPGCSTLQAAVDQLGRYLGRGTLGRGGADGRAEATSARAALGRHYAAVVVLHCVRPHRGPRTRVSPEREQRRVRCDDAAIAPLKNGVGEALSLHVPRATTATRRARVAVTCAFLPGWAPRQPTRPAWRANPQHEMLNINQATLALISIVRRA